MNMEPRSEFLVRHNSVIILIIILFYIVGVLGIVIPLTQPLFVTLIPFALLLNFGVILFFHNSPELKVDLLVLFLIYLSGYLIEVVGVNTHLVFGNYTYGSGLGIKVLRTPLMIGINWVMVAYCSASVLEWTKLPVIIQVLLASIFMVVYDMILEHLAPSLDMWSWEGGTIPLQNYLAWFAISILFTGLLKWRRVKTINPVAPIIFICQLVFFIVILMFVK